MHALELVFHSGREVGVSDDGVDFVRHADEGEGPLVELGGIEYRNDFPGPGNHHLIGAGFLYAWG